MATRSEGIAAYHRESLGEQYGAPKRPVSPTVSSTQAPSEAGSASSGAPAGLFIFDWDDTLFPTTSVRRWLLGADGRSHTAALRSHARLVEDVLRAASSHARVCIVTLAGTGWVEQSAARYLPGLDLPGLLLELDMEIYYARERRGVSARERSCGAAPQDFTTMKMTAMRQAINAAYAHVPCRSQRLNVVSIGDSATERTALQELFSNWGASGSLAFRPLQKTLKLLEDPSLDTLALELSQLLPHLGALHEHPGDLDLTADDPAEHAASPLAFWWNRIGFCENPGLVTVVEI